MQVSTSCSRPQTQTVGLAGVVREGDYRELYWVSYPGARHSQNIAVKPQIAMVVFDSTVPPGTDQAVYMSATGSS
jgi:hypothetical protein